MDDDRVTSEYEGFWVRAVNLPEDGTVLQIVHHPCRRVVLGYYNEDAEVRVEELLFVVQAHRCNG